MASQKIEWRERPCFEPFRSTGVPNLRAEEVSLVAQRREDHIGTALRSYLNIEALDRNAGIDNAAKNSKVIDKGSVVALLRVTRSDWLRIEVIGINEVGMLRAQVEGRREELPGRQN